MAASDYILNLRKQIGHDLLLLPSAMAIILNSKRELLLQETFHQTWSLPGGMIEPGESPQEAVVREVLEETGLEVTPQKIIGVYGGEGFRYTYINGDQVEYSVLLFHCLVEKDTGFISDNETKSLKYFAKEALPALSLPYPIDSLFPEYPNL